MEILTLSAPVPQNGQTQSNNSLSTNCLSVFDHFVGLAFKGLRKKALDLSNSHLKKRSQTMTTIFVSCINTFYSIQTFPVISIMTTYRYLLLPLSVELWLLTGPKQY